MPSVMLACKDGVFWKCISHWKLASELRSRAGFQSRNRPSFNSLSSSVPVIKNTWLFLTVIYCSWFVFSKTLLLWKIFLLEFFRVALLFICQGPALVLWPRNSDILSQAFLLVKHFFYFFHSFSRGNFIITSFPLKVNAILQRKKRILNSKITFFWQKWNGERGIWTLAPRERPTPLAGAPLQPLEYFSVLLNFILYQYKVATPISWRKNYYT